MTVIAMSGEVPKWSVSIATDQQSLPVSAGRELSRLS